MTENDRGNDVDAADNLIVHNSASANTTANYDIGAGNNVGTIQASPVGAGAWDSIGEWIIE